MQIANLADIGLEYEITGSGEPVLFISPVLADAFRPLLEHPSLAGRYQLVHYHRRGWEGSSHTPGPVTIEQHAIDADALLDHLGIPSAHVIGHGSGAAIAAQLAIDHPDTVHTLTLLEFSLLSLPEGQKFLEGAGPVLEIYRAGDHTQAVAAFMSAVGGLDWDTCREVLETSVPGVVDQAIKDADTFFGVELPALAAWTLDPAEATAIAQPTLAVIGADTHPLWVEAAAFLRANLPDVDQAVIEGVGHLLHLQQPDPVAAPISEFLGTHPM